MPAPTRSGVARTFLVVFLGAGALLGCGSIEVEPDADRFADGFVVPGEEHSEAAARIPGYAGHMADGCEIAVWLTQHQSHAAISAARNHFSAEQTRRSRSERECRSIPLRVRRAEHAWSKLDEWSAEARTAMNGVGGPVGVQVRRNRVGVGYESDAARSDVKTRLRASGVPRSALLLGPSTDR